MEVSFQQLYIKGAIEVWGMLYFSGHLLTGLYVAFVLAVKPIKRLRKAGEKKDGKKEQ